MTLEELIVQVSAEADRNAQEAELAAKGVVPLVVFANGPETGFLLGFSGAQIDSAIADAIEMRQERPGERTPLREVAFAAAARAVESNFGDAQAGEAFAGAALVLFAQALVQNGVDRRDMIGCAVRYNRFDLSAPEFERAPKKG
jgi:hypothetical protein